MAGGKIDILVNPDVKDFPGKLESGLQGSLATAGKIGAALGLSIGAAATAKSVFDLGVAFDKQMNTMAAVSQASAAQLEAVGEKARELGKSTDLTATSASDAAAAMTELVKGGFAVEEAMDAAKGTLQLASAAQIEAAEAATIQSQALQAFGLDASYAATASDILAGAANASSADIRGIANGLQQSGAVANQFGLTLEDNATALAMFANAGIQGSDAGTLLKTALLSMTKDSKAAQGAMEDLGLSVYTAEGKFVGMEALFGQLADAQKRMTDEQYQSATAALFGSDAMRMAGVAAREGAEGWRETYDAVTRAGQASEVAAAQAQGLPGVLEAIQNQAEDTGLAVYDAFKDIALGTGQGLVAGIEAAAPVIELTARQLAALVEAAGPAVGLVGDLAGGMSGLIGPISGVAAALAVDHFTGFSRKVSTGAGAVKLLGAEAKANQAFFSKMGREISLATGALVALEERSPVLNRMGDAYRETGKSLRVAGAMTRAASVETHGLHQQVMLAKGSMQSFGGVAQGVAAGGLSALKSGASGLIGFLGGPWGAAFTAAGLAVGYLVQQHQAAALAEAEHEASQRALRDTLDSTTGAVTEQTRALQEKTLQESGVLDTARELGIAQSTVVDAAMGNASAQREVAAAVEASTLKAIEGSSAWEKHRDAFEKAGFGAEDLTAALNGNREAAGDITRAGLKKTFIEVRHEIKDTAEATSTLTDEVLGAADALNEAETTNAKNQLLELEKQAEQTADVVKAIGDAQFTIRDKQTVTLEPGAINEKTLAQLEEAHGITSEVMNGELILTFENGADVLGLLDEIGIKLEQTDEGYIRINTEDPERAREVLEGMGLKLREFEDDPTRLEIDSNMPEVLAQLEAYGLAEKDGSGKLTIDWSSITTSQEKMEQLKKLVEAGTKGRAEIEENSAEVWRSIQRNLDGKVTYGRHVVTPETAAVMHASAVMSGGRGRTVPYADGAVRKAADGWLSDQEAQIARGGSWLVWAEDETQGESFIPHAPAKRARATQIMAATADIFGLGLVDADGNRITRDGTPVGPLASGNVRTFAGGGIVESITGLVRKHFPMMQITSTYRNTNDHHGAGKAVDFSNGYDTTPEMQQAARFFYQNYKSQLAELIHWPLNGWTNVKDGQHLNYGEPTNSQHRNHVHIAAHAPLGAPGTTDITAGMQGVSDSLSVGDTALGYSYQSHKVSERAVDWGEAGDLNQRARRYLGVYDQGGWLPSGGMAVNLGSKPEPVFSPPQWSLLQRAIDSLPALIDALRSGDTARARDVGAGMTAAVLADVEVQAKAADAAVLAFGESLGGEVVSKMPIVQDAERGLIETRKGLAEEAAALSAQEREVIRAREALTKAEAQGGEVSKSTSRKIEDAERRLAEARSGGKPDKIADAERNLARAREDASEQMSKSEEKAARDVQQARETVDKAERDLAEMRELSETAAKRLEAAERTVIAARYQAIADLSMSVGDAFAQAAGGARDLFAALADQAKIMEETRQRLRAEQIEAQTAALSEKRARLDLLIAEQDIARVRAFGAIAIADAEAALAQAREAATLKGQTGIDAMSRAWDRARTSGIFAVEDVAQSVVDNAASVRAAQHAVEAARAQAALDELTAAHRQKMAVLDLAQATLTQQKAVALVDISTRQLAAQAAELGGLTAQGAQRASGGWGGLAKAGSGLGKILGGLAGAAAGFAVGGPVGALVGALPAIGGVFEVLGGARQAWNNRDEIKQSWSGMDTMDKIIVGGGLLTGAAVGAGGAALSGQYGGEMAIAAANLGAEIAAQSAGYAQASIIADLERINSLAEEERAQLDYQLLLEQARIERERWAAEMEFASGSAALSADVEIAELLGRIAEADTTAQADALAAAAIVAAERRDQMLDVLARQLNIAESQASAPRQQIHITLPTSPLMSMPDVESLIDTIGRVQDAVEITRSTITGAEYLAART